jgi:hypothetical protein
MLSCTTFSTTVVAVKNVWPVFSQAIIRNHPNCMLSHDSVKQKKINNNQLTVYQFVLYARVIKFTTLSGFKPFGINMTALVS